MVAVCAARGHEALAGLCICSLLLLPLLPLLPLLLLLLLPQLHINESSYLQLVEVQESMSYPGLLTQVRGSK